MSDSREGKQSAPTPDPFELWRQMYETSERTWGKAMQEAMSTPAFAEAQGKMLETFLSFQKAMRDSMTAQMGSLNLPTRDDLSRLGELLVGIEEKLDQLDERLAALERRLSSGDGTTGRQTADRRPRTGARTKGDGASRSRAGARPSSGGA